VIRVRQRGKSSKPTGPEHESLDTMSCLSRFALVMIGVVAPACATQHSPRQAPNPNRYIYVTAESLPGQCYRDLGTIQFDEPFANATIDADGSEMAKKIRALAVAKYPNDVDAIISLRSEQNEVGTTVTVAGEAAEIEDHTTVACTLRGMPGVLDATLLRLPAALAARWPGAL
jgi:hypothetical protein